VGFQQAAIKVAKEKEFGELKAAFVRIFAADRVEQFLGRL